MRNLNKLKRSNTMAKSKISLTHEHERIIAVYCAYKNIEFNQANAYDITMEAFKDNPIKYKTTDDITGEERNYNITPRIATLIERQPKTIDRIADKIERKKDEIQKEKYNQNIAKVKERTCPDINKLVDNLYRLNLVDEKSYLGLVCFLMQVKYLRDGELEQDDKLCAFFNGVAHNGKSATAKAIMKVEEQYGPVFKANSVKLLLAPHEERIYKTHVVYFDEAKASDIDRDKVINLINGGDIELNPKNKRQYLFHVNTNVIFASNDMVYLRQRRVAIIKFGKRLNCRPLGEGTLTEIITNIMDSLPSFEHYDDLYQVVSINNENAVSMVAMADILAYMHHNMELTCPANPLTMNQTVLLTPSYIYEHIKHSRHTQLVNPERRDAIPDALEYLAEQGLLTRKPYISSTKFYMVSGEQYLKIREKFDVLNTKYEKISKISKVELYDCLLPYFTAIPNPDDLPQIECPEPTEADYWEEADNTPLDENTVINSSWTKGRGAMLALRLLKRILQAEETARCINAYDNIHEIVNHLFDEYITLEFCQCVCYEEFMDSLDKHLVQRGVATHCDIQNRYITNLGLKNFKELQAFEKNKRAEIKEINSKVPGLHTPTE